MRSSRSRSRRPRMRSVRRSSGKARTDRRVGEPAPRANTVPARSLGPELEAGIHQTALATLLPEHPLDHQTRAQAESGNRAPAHPDHRDLTGPVVKECLERLVPFERVDGDPPDDNREPGTGPALGACDPDRGPDRRGPCLDLLGVALLVALSHPPEGPADAFEEPHGASAAAVARPWRPPSPGLSPPPSARSAGACSPRWRRRSPAPPRPRRRSPPPR